MSGHVGAVGVIESAGEVRNGVLFVWISVFIVVWAEICRFRHQLAHVGCPLDDVRSYVLKEGVGGPPA